MMRFTTTSALLLSTLLSMDLPAQTSNPWEVRDPLELRLQPSWTQPTAQGQGRLFASPAWRLFAGVHPGWQVLFDESMGSVHRAFGPAIADVDPEEFMEQRLTEWAPGIEVAPWRMHDMGRNTVLRTHQVVAGRKVRGSELTVKSAPEGIISWGLQVDATADWPDAIPEWEEVQLIAAAMQGLGFQDQQCSLGDEYLVADGPAGWMPVRECTITGSDADGIPVRYRVLLDLHTLEVVERENTVRHADRSGQEPPVEAGSARAPMLIAAEVVGTVHATQPFEDAVEVPLDHLTVNTQSGVFTTFDGGQLFVEGNDPLGVSIPLSGLWSHVQSNGVTPVMEAQIAGDTVLSIDPGSNIRERSAYYNVGRIHDHMKFWLPDFTLLDFPLPTNVDVSGTCNAFYSPGGTPSINFYSEGDGCNAFSLVADVVYHEYGHGINDLYYESIGASFINGAMGEGYADLWAISLSDNPVLGAGCYQDNAEFFIRRYDEDPKVYPEDLVGQVHADGEIICGAWYDTHLLMGADWSQTMALFVAAYGGMQAETPNGNEGEAFVEVLIDVLEADDDDGNLTNGTPNGTAILQGFAIHGISLFSNVAIGHEPEAYTSEETPITITAEADIQFPLNLVQFFSHMNLYYRTSPFSPWLTLVMEDNGDGTFSADIPAQPMGTVVEYHFGIVDDFGAVSTITPFSANQVQNPNLPFNTMVGVTPVLVDDQDDFSDFGFWQLGLPEDNATTGEWESTIPVGSFSNGPGDPASICAPDEDHTPGDGLFCFLTGVSPGPDAGIGSNDVDGGSTTLQSEDIDLSDMLDPVMSYWRWYVNAPASGANPGADWWQVAVSDDGGDTWVEVEETLTQDISWRRNAFRIQEYVGLTDAFRIRFVASDSLRLGQEYDGGSLIEAAVDDLVIHDLVVIGVAEHEGSGIIAWPVPFSERLHAAGWQPGTLVGVLDPLGREVERQRADARGEVHFDLDGTAAGTFILHGVGRDGGIRRKEVVGGGR